MTSQGQPAGSRAASVYRGSRLVAGRRPKINERHRLCSDDACDTVLSRYNLGEMCRVHAPVRYPRVRGRVVDSQAG